MVFMNRVVELLLLVRAVRHRDATLCFDAPLGCVSLRTARQRRAARGGVYPV